MKTKAATQCLDAILEKARQYEEYARYAAIDYASTDKEESKISFKNNSELNAIFRKLHGEIAQYLHSVEAEMEISFKK